MKSTEKEKEKKKEIPATKPESQATDEMEEGRERRNGTKSAQHDNNALLTIASHSALTSSPLLKIRSVMPSGSFALQSSTLFKNASTAVALSTTDAIVTVESIVVCLVSDGEVECECGHAEGEERETWERMLLPLLLV